MRLGEEKRDCRQFQGHIPCKPHKKEGVECPNCPYYDPVKERILIIKLVRVVMSLGPPLVA